MGTTESSIGNIGLMGGESGRRVNAPKEYADRRRQYFGNETAAFESEYARYATDYVQCRIQGLVPGDFYAWSVKNIRLADTIKQGISLTRKTDDQKAFLLPDRSIDYVPEGAKVETMGSTWLVTNPSNLSSAVANGIMRRCNATWNHLDWYGNLLKEPILVEKQQAMANANDFQEVSLIMQGYFNIIVQRNADTDELDQNSRLILGRRAYQITGYSDVTQEFTVEDESTHLLYFAARMQEPNLEIDDMENRVAGGRTFSWEIVISGNGRIYTGETAQFSAAGIRCGEPAADTPEHPVSYTWSSSDESIAAVDADGTVHAHSAGTCRILCTLEQNPEISQSFELTVEDAASGYAVLFGDTVPERIACYKSAQLTAVCFENGQQAEGTVQWTFENADAGAYTAQVSGNTVRISCWAASALPLKVTAQWNGAQASAQIHLLGI